MTTEVKNDSSLEVSNENLGTQEAEFNEQVMIRRQIGRAHV